MKLDHLKPKAATVIIVLTLVTFAGVWAGRQQTEVPVNLKPDITVKDVPQVPGMRKRELLTTQEGTVVTLRIKSEKWCYEGDYDFIRRDVEASEHTRLLVSVEPLFHYSPPVPPISFDLELNQIISGSEFSFVLPYAFKPLRFGIYICKDSKETGTCGDKEVLDIDTLHTEQVHQKLLGERGDKSEPVQAPGDKVYYFSYFLLDGNELHALNNQMDVAAYQQLENFERSVGSHQVDISTLTGMVKTMNSKLSSGNLDLTQPIIEINLPRSSPETCGTPERIVEVINGVPVEMEVKHGLAAGPKYDRDKPGKLPGNIKYDGSAVLIPKR